MSPPPSLSAAKAIQLRIGAKPPLALSSHWAVRARRCSVGIPCRAALREPGYRTGSEELCLCLRRCGPPPSGPGIRAVPRAVSGPPRAFSGFPIMQFELFRAASGLAGRPRGSLAHHHFTMAGLPDLPVLLFCVASFSVSRGDALSRRRPVPPPSIPTSSWPSRFSRTRQVWA